MNVDYLKSLLRNAGDEPDRIQQLRKLIVALAVSGRFGVNKRSHDLPSISPTALPTHFEETSGFTVLGAVARIEKGRTGIKQAVPGAYPLVVTAAERSPCDHFDFEGPAAIVPLVSSTGHGKASLHRLHYQEGKFALGTILAAIFPLDASLVSARFIFEYLSAFKEELLVSRMIGTANVSLSVGKIAEVPIPLVSLDVQAKVDELMALCDQLEAARAEREATRDRLAAASLTRLNAPDPETFVADAHFALDALPSLTARADQIKQLRQTILGVAVCGRLVEQDPADEPASELLKRIGEKKSQMAAARAIKLRKTNARERRETLDWLLPENWILTDLGTISLKITDGAHKTPTYVQKGVPFVSVKDFSAGQLNLTSTRCIPNSEHEVLYKRCDPRRGDILLGRIGTIGKAVLVDTDVEFSLFVSVGLIRFDHHCLVPEFFRLLLNSPFVEKEFDRIKIGGGTHTNKLNLGDLHTVAVPLPPLAEQKRIVAKVGVLMALCDQLEASLASADDSRRRLLDALLAEALQPALQAAA